MKAGAHTTYKDEYIDKVYEYVEQCVDTEYTFHKTQGQSSDSYERHIKVCLPTVEGFAHYIKTPLRTINDWRKYVDEAGNLLHEEFSQAIEFLLEKQKIKLLESGLSGDYNPTIAKLALGNNHGMKERSDVTTDDKQINGVIILPAEKI